MADADQTKVTLHWLDGSRAHATLWLLQEFNIPFEVDIYHRNKDGLAPPALEKIWPLGKAPVLTVHPPGGAEAVVLAESGFIVQYLCDHWGQNSTLVPKRWKEGQEGKVGGETEEWLKFQYLLYYDEGSLMPWLVLYMILSVMRGPKIPFFIRPFTSMVAGKFIEMLVFPNIVRNCTLLESFLEKSGGTFLCGTNLTAADVLASYPLLAAKDNLVKMGTWEKGSPKATYPLLWAYLERLESQPGWKKAVEKIKEMDGGKFSLVPENSDL